MIICGLGLGNRVATMANAFSRYDEFDFAWRVNKHCPLNHSQVFPHGIEGVRFVDDPPAFSTRWGRSNPGYKWESTEDRSKANLAYSRIINAMAGSSHSDGHVSIIARFLPYPHIDGIELADRAKNHGKPVYIFTDSRRSIIADHLSKSGLKYIMPKCDELVDDLSRDIPNALLFLGDWKTAIASDEVITHPENSSLIYPIWARFPCCNKFAFV